MGMLVLSRKRNQQIVIDGNIVVTIVDIRGGNVRVGIEAPTDVSVHREEVHRVIQEKKAQAAATAAAQASSAPATGTSSPSGLNLEPGPGPEKKV